MDAEQALDEIDAYQLRMWLAYIELEPVDAEAGLVASMLANVNRASKDAPYFKPTDFSAFVVEEPVSPRTPEERWAKLKGDLNLLAAASRARREKREREQAGGHSSASTMHAPAIPPITIDASTMKP